MLSVWCKSVIFGAIKTLAVPVWNRDRRLFWRGDFKDLGAFREQHEMPSSPVRLNRLVLWFRVQDLGFGV
jgi:hypothetical protein